MCWTLPSTWRFSLSATSFSRLINFRIQFLPDLIFRQRFSSPLQCLVPEHGGCTMLHNLAKRTSCVHATTSTRPDMFLSEGPQLFCAWGRGWPFHTIPAVSKRRMAHLSRDFQWVLLLTFCHRAMWLLMHKIVIWKLGSGFKLNSKLESKPGRYCTIQCQDIPGYISNKHTDAHKHTYAHKHTHIHILHEYLQKTYIYSTCKSLMSLSEKTDV